MLPENYVMDEGVIQTIDALNRNEPVIYLAGKAGVGKSTFIQFIRRNTNKLHVVVASTGIAALNVQGQTIHSFFRFPPKMLENVDIKQRDDEILKKLELIIVDEVSMVRADVMDAIDFALRKWRKDKRPFGGVQMLLVGDCFQLSPVVTNNERVVFDRMYRSPWFFDANVFKKVKMHPVELKTIYRQTDSRFIKLLHHLRIKKDLQNTIHVLNKECYMKKKESSLYLTPTNDFANVVNREMLNCLTGQEYVYEAIRTGYVSVGGRENLPAPEELKLKVGARVMIKKNIEGAVNGSLGTAVSCGKDYVDVELDSGGVVSVVPETWTSYKYVYNTDTESVEALVAGKYTQIPLILGWAVTIHKSQGLTLDSVELDLGRGCFASGQAYVALSRCKRLETLTLTEPLTVNDVIIDQRVIEFYNETFGG